MVGDRPQGLILHIPSIHTTMYVGYLYMIRQDAVTSS